MSLYQAKHKARGRYGVIDETGQWLAGFLGTQQEATLKAKTLNGQTLSTVTKTAPSILHNRRLQKFTLTEQGWLYKGE